MKVFSKILLTASAVSYLLSAAVVAMEAKPDKDAAGIPAKKASTAGGAGEVSLKVETESTAKTSISSSTTGAGAGAGAQAEEQLYFSALEKRLAKLFFQDNEESFAHWKKLYETSNAREFTFLLLKYRRSLAGAPGGEELWRVMYYVERRAKRYLELPYTIITPRYAKFLKQPNLATLYRLGGI